jgi:diguanylate cyclase (GGDEF)-like protein
MEMDYTAFYVEANIVSIIIFLMMFIREVGSVGRQSKQVIFLNMIIAHIMYFTSDIFWALILGGYLPGNYFSVSVANLMNALIIGAITSFWFVYVEISQGEEYIKKFRNRMIVMIPAIVNTLVLLVLFTVFPGTVITEDYHVTLTYYLLFLGIPIGYIVASTIRSFVRAFRKDNYAVRSAYIVSGIYPIILSIFGVMQTLWLEAPMFCFGCSIMMLYVYITSLNDQVSIDELTKLNNRTQLKKYVASEAQKQSSDKYDRYVLMVDLNKFKQINDQYGHVEGDYALKRTADALKLSCSENPMRTFIARYGGDEFIIIAKTDKEENIKALCQSIRDNLKHLNKKAGAEYELTASIGYSPYSGDIASFQAALAKADDYLYKEKGARGPVK